MNERVGGRPTKQQAAERTENLLDAARELFCARGFAGTSIDEIAAVLRSSKHTIYRRYASKLLLLEAVVDRDVSRFRRALLDAAVAETNPVAALRSMARAYFGFSASPDACLAGLRPAEDRESVPCPEQIGDCHIGLGQHLLPHKADRPFDDDLTVGRQAITRDDLKQRCLADAVSTNKTDTLLREAQINAAQHRPSSWGHPVQSGYADRRHAIGILSSDKRHDTVSFIR